MTTISGFTPGRRTTKVSAEMWSLQENICLGFISCHPLHWLPKKIVQIKNPVHYVGSRLSCSLQIQIIEIHIFCVYSPQWSDDILCGDNHIIQGGFFDCSAQKTTKYKEKLKYQNCSANCSSQKILSTRKKQSIRTETTAHVYSCISTSRVSKHFLQ